MEWTVILAQEVPSIPMTGVAGWISAGTGIGLLGGVLYWLCYHHIPKVLDQNRAAIESITAQNKEVMTSKDAAIIAKDLQIAQLVKDFKEEMREGRVQAREQNSSQRQAFEQTLERVTKEAKEQMVSERQECSRRLLELVQQWRTERREDDRHGGTDSGPKR